MNEITKSRIKNLLIEVMERTINRRVIQEPFDENLVIERNPFGVRLVPMEIWKGSKFERSFVTTLGQSIFENIAAIIAEGAGAVQVVRQHVEEFQINTFRDARINNILRQQRNNQLSPNWEEEVSGLLLLEHSDTTAVKSTSDLFLERPDGTREYYSLKTVKPNLDQTEIAKRDMLRLKAFNHCYKTYFGLPFNPAGEGNAYRRGGHSMPYKLFRMDEDECVLIGAALWNRIGDNSNTYNELLEIFEDVGADSSERIRREYLGLE